MGRDGLISRVIAREVLDSRGAPTVEVDIHCRDGSLGRAIVPSGASTGTAEAWELRDGDQDRYDGRGVRQAVRHVCDQIGPRLIGVAATDQLAIDQMLLELDGTPNKSRLGGNAILGVSLAAAHAAAASQQRPLFRHLHELYSAIDGNSRPPRLPLPMTNMISGGLHAGGNLDFQDILIMPVGAGDYGQGLEWMVRVYRRLGKLLADAGYEGRLVGDEGGYGPRLPNNHSAVQFVVDAVTAAGCQPGRDVTIAIDVASTHFFQPQTGRYRLAVESARELTSTDMIDVLESWTRQFPITSIEDGLSEDDWEGWRELTRRLGERVRLVGDDLFATRVDRLRRGIELGAANSALIKVNQVGTLTETLQAIQTARAAGYSIVVSARSGETEDATTADLAVAVAADLIKIGSIVRGERTAKYNQLLRLAEHLG